nr:hypothetical protein [Tanacetum cinerariifolium]
AGADAGAQLLRGRRATAAAAGRYARLWLRQGAASGGQEVALPGQRFPARPPGAQARAGADRFTPRHQGCRPRDPRDARQGGGELP